MQRRSLLAGAASGLVAIAGCVTSASKDEETPTDRSPSPGSKESPDSEALTGWENSIECEQSPTGMYDSVIKVNEVTTELEKGFAPIRFSDLTTEEQEILRTVTDVGGYATCDTSDAFYRFIERIGNHREQQTNSDVNDMHIYLERGGTYYRLYVEKLDEVYAY